jgi:hypothetical protein
VDLRYRTDSEYSCRHSAPFPEKIGSSESHLEKTKNDKEDTDCSMVLSCSRVQARDALGKRYTYTVASQGATKKH